MSLTRDAKRSVETVSSTWAVPGHTFAIITCTFGEELELKHSMLSMPQRIACIMGQVDA